MDVVARSKLRRSFARPDSDATGELSLVPYLDIVVNVVMFLLATSVVAIPMSQIAVDSPGVCRAPPCVRPSDPVTVAITRSGFRVSTSLGSLAPGCRAPGPGPSVPLADDAHDFEGLSRCALEIRRGRAEPASLVLTADERIPYETVVRTMDAVRERDGLPLFPDVSLSAGIQ